MKCEKCNAREATVLFKQTINGNTTTLHLCGECAAELQQGDLFAGSAFPFGGNLFGGLFGTKHADSTLTRKICPQCGAAWSEIRRDGKPHCPACYKTFESELEPTLRSLYGTAAHTGRAPAACKAARDRQNRSADLKRRLREAIDAEQYEEAARLRDEIKALEKEGE